MNLVKILASMWTSYIPKNLSFGSIVGESPACEYHDRGLGEQ